MLIAARNAMMAGKRLPYDAEVEYLESTGTQWIDTGILPNQTMQVEGCFQRNNSDYAYVFGCGGNWTSVGSNSCSLLLFPTSGIQGHIGNASVSAGVNPVQYVFDFRLSLTYGIELKPKWSTAWTSVSYSTESQSQVFSGTLPVALFANRSGQSTTIRTLVGRIYSIQIWRDGVLAGDFLPVRFTNEQGQTEGAMYDRLGVGGMNPDGSARNDGLYRNRGTNAFVWGPDK